MSSDHDSVHDSVQGRVHDGQSRGWYFTSIASFMIPAGIQAVLLPHLLAIQLHQDATRFGVTQMLGQLPLLILLPIGGWLADRRDSRQLLMGLQAGAIVVPLTLAWALWQARLNESLVLLYAVSWGMIAAFAMPARDGLLSRVAGSNVQRMVTLTMGVQFGTQIIGYGIGGLTEHSGPIAILLAQCTVLLLGIHAARQLPAGASNGGAAQAATRRGAIWSELSGGLTLLLANAPMRAAFLLTAGIGVFFVGTFVVLMPFALRDLYDGRAQDISLGFAVFSIGTLTSIAGLMRSGGVRYPGRALVAVLYFGCAVLLPVALAPPEWLFYVCIFCWGMGGGVAMTMARTIMQEHAPASHRARVLAAFALANAGGAPIGSLLMGLAVAAAGVQLAVLLPILGVATVTTVVLVTHSIWQLQSTSK